MFLVHWQMRSRNNDCHEHCMCAIKHVRNVNDEQVGVYMRRSLHTWNAGVVFRCVGSSRLPAADGYMGSNLVQYDHVPKIHVNMYIDESQWPLPDCCHQRQL